MDWPGWIMAVAAVACMGGGLYVYFVSQIAAIRARHDDDIEAEATARLALERDLAAYKLHVSQHHVTNAALRETEERLINALEKLATRVETMAARIENVFVEMAKARVST